MHIKVLGVGCSSCQRMLDDVKRIIQRNGWQNIQVEYVQDIERILSYGVMSTPALVIQDQVVLVGYRGMDKIEQAIKNNMS
ncbi:MAG: thioredoxin family protein [Chloroflexota bacterium]